VQVGNVQSANVEAAVPAELQTFLNRFTTTGCFRQCLPPAVQSVTIKMPHSMGAQKGGN